MGNPKGARGGMGATPNCGLSLPKPGPAGDFADPRRVTCHPVDADFVSGLLQWQMQRQAKYLHVATR